jgi:hypothetical protein
MQNIILVARGSTIEIVWQGSSWYIISTERLVGLNLNIFLKRYNLIFV